MTAVVYHGPPGSCKTASAVWEWAIPALKKGRQVVTNIRGLTLERAAAALKDGEQFPETANVHILPLTPEGYEQAARWFHWVEPGALIILDEVQKVYPSRVRDSSVYDCPQPRPLHEEAEGEAMITVMDAFDQHRHMNWDFVCTTPNIKKVAGFIREVLETAYRQRPMSGVLPFMGNRMKRVKHNADNSGMAFSNSLGNTTFKINPTVFECYKSTATGEIKKSEDKFSFKSQPKIFAALSVPIFSILFLGWYFSGGSSDSKAGADTAEETINYDNAVVVKNVDVGSSDVVHRPVATNHNFVEYLINDMINYRGSIVQNDHVNYLIGGKRGSYQSLHLEQFGLEFEQRIHGVLIVKYADKEYYLQKPKKVSAEEKPLNTVF